MGRARAVLVCVVVVDAVLEALPLEVGLDLAEVLRVHQEALEEDCLFTIRPEDPLFEIAFVVERVLDEVPPSMEAGDQGEVGLQDHRRERHVIVDLKREERGGEDEA